ncbi:MAG: calcium/sodium antiporter [Legionellales bacterium]|nr:calcium/sodium antiporter [Legionellales bacterium]|tara:strand:- start:1198 stop:2175 length:978 start_codon:yes stop_codon:yes gene_type:complete
MLNLFFVIIGIILLTFSAERFIESAAVIAKKHQISPVVIGLIIVGFGTSLPELVVSIVATLHGNLGLPIGNAIGSNITNIALVIGLTAIIKPISVHSNILKRELPLMLFALGIVYLLILNGQITRLNGVFMAGAMAGIIGIFYYFAQQPSLVNDAYIVEIDQEETKIAQKMGLRAATAWLLFGLIMLPISSEILVKGAVGLAVHFGVSEVIIGLTVVAFGTSLPELAASIISVIKNEPDIAVGNIIGSNLFNLLAVLGVPAIIQPLPVKSVVLARDYPVMLGLSLLFFLMCFGKPSRQIKRWHGIVLFILYMLYIASLCFDTAIK